MRNLKKALSLVLAMVMLLGMMVVGAGAADFKDEAQISDEYKTAAAVLKQIGVMEGTDGNLNPKAGLSRAEGAAIIYRVFTSGLDKNPAGDSGFVDVDGVPSFSWASGTVAACRDLGILSGVDATHFAPGESLTGSAFAKMLLVTLGYESDKQGYEGASWAANVARDARARNILLEAQNMSAVLTREEAAQMAFQALTADTMEYTGMNITTPDGLTISSPATVRKYDSVNGTTGGGKTYNYVDIQPATTPIKLCEEKFPALKLTTTEDESFGRAQEVWTWKNVEIAGTVTDVAPDNTFIAETNASGIASAIGRNTSSGLGYTSNGTYYVSNVPVFVNGQETYVDMGTPAKAQDEISKLTKDGRLVEVYLGKDNKAGIEKVVAIDTALGEVTKVDDKKETLTIKMVASNATNNQTFSLSTKEGYGSFKKDDLVLVQATYNATKAADQKTYINKGSKIQSVTEPTKIVGVATALKYSDATTSVKLAINGEEYGDAWAVDPNRSVAGFSLDKKFDSTVYLDANNYVVRAIPGSDPNATTDNLIAITDCYLSVDNSGRATYMVEGVISNGQTVTMPSVGAVTTSDDDSVFTYSATPNTRGQYTFNALGSTTDRALADVTSTTANTYVADLDDTTGSAAFKKTDSRGLTGTQAAGLYYADDVKFIFAKNGDVTILEGQQDFTHSYVAKRGIAQALRWTNNDHYEITAVFVEGTSNVKNTSNIIYVAGYRNQWDLLTREDGSKYYAYQYEAYAADGTPVEDFAGDKVVNTPRFIQAKKDNDGLYRMDNTESSGVVLPIGVVSGNGTNGNIFTTKGEPIDYLTAKNLQVVDTCDSGISTVAEMNRRVTAGENVEVAIIYNEDGTNRTAVAVYVVSASNSAKSAGQKSVADIKALPDGVYTVSKKPNDWPVPNGNFGKGNPQDVVGFKFSIPEVATNNTSTVTLTISDDSGSVYVETYKCLDTNHDNTAGTAHVFWVQVTNTKAGGSISRTKGATVTDSYESGGEWSAFPEGSYTYTVEFSKLGDGTDTYTIGSGSFQVAKAYVAPAP